MKLINNKILAKAEIGAVYFLTGLGLLCLVFFIFVPAFQGRLAINPLIQIGNFTFRWYGVILGAAILLGYAIVRKNSWKFGISQAEIDSLAFWLTVAGIVGARIYFVLFSFPYFAEHPAEIYKIWRGGLSIYGGLIASTVLLYFYSRKKAYTFWQIADCLAIGLPLGQAVGRFGNFINQEAFGIPTNLPWKMYILPDYRPAEFAESDFFHPTFLYEALANLLIFFLLYRLVGRLKPGALALIYGFGYSVSRFFIEIIRTDSFYVLGMKADQLTAFLLIMSSAYLFYDRQLRSG